NPSASAVLPARRSAARAGRDRIRVALAPHYRRLPLSGWLGWRRRGPPLVLSRVARRAASFTFRRAGLGYTGFGHFSRRWNRQKGAPPMRFLERFTEPIYAVFRIVFGLLFASHGAQKVFGWFTVPGQTKADSLPVIAAGWFEIIAGLLIAIGFFTALEMAGAAILTRGEVPVLYCVAFLYMAARVPGLWSVDQMRRKT